MARKKSRARSRTPVTQISIILIALMVVGLALLKTWLFFHSDRGRAWMLVRLGQERTPRATELLAHAVRSTLHVVGATEKESAPVEGPDHELRWSLQLPPTISLTQANYALTSAVREAGGRILDAVEEPGEGNDSLVMSFGLGSEPTHRVVFLGDRSEKAAPRARLAVLLEDMDPRRDGLLCENTLLASFLALEQPFSYGVIPAEGASLHSEAIHNAHGEVLLYLPMESRGGLRDRRMPQAVVVDMNPSQVRRQVRDHLDEVTHVEGIVNYQGSLASQDPGVMRAVMAEAKSRGLFYVDAATDEHSAAQAAAVASGTQCLEGPTRLDAGGASARVIAQRLEDAGERSLRGEATVVMARMTPELVEILRAELPRLRARGIQIVKASDLARLGD